MIQTSESKPTKFDVNVPSDVMPELLRRMDDIPEYHALFVQCTRELLRKLDREPEAARALGKIMTRYGINIEEIKSTGTEREPITAGIAIAAGLAFVGGVVVGIWSER
jgi:hypothetical protein